jgi:acetylornithine deacetylase/succinyl-diaminopimelate desuccinylase-like protein
MAACVLSALSACARGGSSSEAGLGPGTGSRGAWPAEPDLDGAYALSVAAELSGYDYEGRQAGSPGGYKAGDYILQALRQAGFDARAQEFPERAAFYEGRPLLSVALEGFGPREYRYRVDYRDLVREGYEGGEAEGPLILVNSAGQAGLRGAIALLPYRLYEADGLEPYRRAGVAGLVIELGAGSVRAKPLYAGQEPGALVRPRSGLVALAMEPSAFAELADAVAARLATAAPGRAAIASPVRFKDVKARNIVASWNGDGGAFEPSVVFMAHYDHVGLDPSGLHFPGALDNAAGVGLILALARAVASDRAGTDLAFVFTDAEESGLTGARAFAEAPGFPLEGARVINVDMLGSARELPVGVLYGGGEAAALLAGRVAAALRGAGFKAGAQEGHYGADHAPLAAAGVAAVTVNEYDTADYHTLDDLPAGLLESELDAAGDALYALALDLARGD